MFKKFFSIQNIKINCYIVFLKSFPIIFFWWKSYSFPVKVWFFIFSADLSWFPHDLTRLSIYKTSVTFLLIGFIVAFLLFSSQENLYVIHHDSDLFYDIFNIINEHNRRQTRCLSSILNYFDIFFQVNQNVLL